MNNNRNRTGKISSPHPPKNIVPIPAPTVKSNAVQGGKKLCDAKDDPSEAAQAIVSMYNNARPIRELQASRNAPSG